MKPIRFAPSEWTYSEYARLPDDGNHYEVLDGEVLMTPAAGTRHQRVALRLVLQLYHYVAELGLGEVFYDIDLLFAEGHYLRPDILFVPNSQREGVTDRGMERTPGLVVEVLSPSSGTIDMGEEAAPVRGLRAARVLGCGPSRPTDPALRLPLGLCGAHHPHRSPAMAP